MKHYVEKPRQIAKQALDQADTDVSVVNGTEKQAFINALLENKMNINQLFW